MSRLVAGRRSPEVPAAFPVERLPGLLRWLRIVSHWAGFFSGNRAAFRVPVPEYAPVRAPFRRKVSRACFVPHALSHLFPESRGASRARPGVYAPPGCAIGRLGVPFVPRYGAYLPGLIGPGDPGVPGALSRRSDTSDMPGRALVVGRRGSGPGSDSTRAGDGPGWSDMRPGPNRRTRAILSRRPHAGQAAGSRVAAVHRRPHPEHRRRTRGESVSVIGVTPPGPRRSNRILPRCTDRRSTGKTPGASGAGH